MASVLPPDSQYQWGSWLWAASPSVTRCSGWSSWYCATGQLPTFSAFPQVQSKYYSRTVQTCSQSKARATDWLLSSVYRPSLCLHWTKSVPESGTCTWLSLHCLSLPFKGIFSLILVDRKFHYESTLGAVSLPSGVMKGVWDVGTWSLELVIGIWETWWPWGSRGAFVSLLKIGEGQRGSSKMSGVLSHSPVFWLQEPGRAGFW